MSRCNGSHGMEQGGGRSSQWDHFLLERIALTVIRIGKESATEGDEMVHVRNGRPINAGKLDNKVLTGRSAHLEHRGSRRARHQRRRRGVILLPPVRDNLQFIAPGTHSLKSHTSPTVWLQFIALNLALAAR